MCITLSRFCPICSGATLPLIERRLAGTRVEGGGSGGGQANPRRIDTHHHVVPPAFIAAYHMENSPQMRSWSRQGSLDQMDESGTEVGILSINAPGIVLLERESAKTLARVCNEYAADMMRDHPKRYGFLTALPMLFPDDSLEEIAYGLDTLKSDGGAVVTSYQDKLLGDPLFQPIWQELNRRKAVVFAHPSLPHGRRGLQTRVLEMVFDTARTIVDMLAAGTFRAYPDIRFIFAHGGGALPFLHQRVTEVLGDEKLDSLPEGLAAALKPLHFDVVGVVNEPSFRMMRALYDSKQLLYGSDYPFRTLMHTASRLESLGLPETELHAINRGNALKLFPRFVG